MPLPPAGPAHADHFDYEDPSYLKTKEFIHIQPKPDAQKVAKEKGCPQSVYLTYIKTELDNESNCLQLPMTILLLISFSYLAMAHLSQNQIYAVEESVEFDISENANFAFAHAFGHKGIADVNSIADFWSWIRLGLIPLLIQPTWSYSEGYPGALGTHVLSGTGYSQGDLPTSWLFPGYQTSAPVQNDYMRYHKIIGGIRMSQEVVHGSFDDCRRSATMDKGGAFANWLAKPCNPAGVAELPPELVETERFGDLERVQWILPELDTLEELKHVLLDMEDGCTFAVSTGAPLSSCRCRWCREQNPRQPWLDEQTLRLEAAFIIFNPAYGLYTYVGVNFFFNRGGHIHKFINVMSAWSDPTASPVAEQIPTWIADILWCGALAYVMVTESKEIVNLVRNSKERWYRTIWDDYVDIWNVIDWVSIIVALFIVQFYIRMRLDTATVNEQLTEMIKISLDKPERAVYEETTETFFVLVQGMCAAEKEFRRMLCVYPMIVMMRLFKSFKAQPRLGLVTATMSKASQDMLHFFIVFLSVYVCMMVNSILFFGQDVQEFGSVPRAIHSCFRAMFGDWDWDAMKEIGFVKAQIWFWLFMIIMVLILLNMLLAIVMDAYTEVKSKAANAATLLHQMQEMQRRRKMYRKGERVKLNEIYDVFLEAANGDEKAMLKNETLLKPEDVGAKINLPMKQATRTLGAALAGSWAAEESAAQVDEEELKEQIKECLDNVEKRTAVIVEDAEYIKNRLSYWDRFQVPGDPEYEFHFAHESNNLDGKADDLDLVSVVDNVSGEIGSMFVTNMRAIETMQDSLQAQQDQLHQLVSEMQMMVDQQVRCVQTISEDMTTIGSPRRGLEEPEAHP
jgi:hypothetical protein